MILNLRLPQVDRARLHTVSHGQAGAHTGAPSHPDEPHPYRFKTSMFSAMRSRRVDLGMTERPCCRPRRNSTCAGLLPCASAIAVTARILKDASAVFAVARVEGDALDRGPRLVEDVVPVVEVEHLALLEVGVDLQLVDRRHDGRRVSSAVRWSTTKLLTPMARTLPSASSFYRVP
ncbi:hypothetical protein [Streptomyces sp. NPDC040750]|uniref:hypothetical protein n=1 Tax=Streptomyces sp. NPDC040750 TaxID=3154491 RepID=UPI0033F6F4C5